MSPEDASDVSEATRESLAADAEAPTETVREDGLARLEEALLAAGVAGNLDGGERERRGPPPPGEGSRDDDLGMAGLSEAMCRLRLDLRNVAAWDIPVFLAGESGTGKELAARAIHRLSARARGPFAPVNCAALPEGLLESELFGYLRGAFSGAATDREGLVARADRGIVFLDEVGDLSPAVQAKLLRVVELGEVRPVGAPSARRVDVRFLCATHRDMEREVAEGRFRPDLYYRLLATARVELPPLRDRPGDVALLLRRFVAREAGRHGVSPLVFRGSAVAALERHPFPGNVRELERMVAGLYARCRGRPVEVGDLPPAVRGAGRPATEAASLAEARRAFERRYLSELLARHRGNRTHAARTAGVARQTLVAMLRRHGLGSVRCRDPGERRTPSGTLTHHPAVRR